MQPLTQIGGVTLSQKDDFDSEESIVNIEEHVDAYV